MPEPQSGVLATSPHPPYFKSMCQEGLEPPTLGLEGRCSIQLSYWHTIGAGDGNRTHVAGLEGQNSTIELHPQHHTLLPSKKNSIGVEGFEPPAPWSQTTYSTKLSHTPLHLCPDDESYSIRFYGVWQAFFSYFLKKFSLFFSDSVKRPQEARLNRRLMSSAAPGLISTRSLLFKCSTCSIA